MSILHISLSPQSLSFSQSLTSPTPLFLHTTLSFKPLTPTFIRMGGGPRTFPGGVSKWQWKRMQAKKSKQLLKARLCRERQIYEMRKRAELKAAVSELERPWEVVEKPPNLFSVSADEQVKVLADRFQKPGGFDLWTERDGPELFRTMEDLPSARFFPKGVVHSVRPYKRVGDGEMEEEGFRGVKELVDGLRGSQGLGLRSESELVDGLRGSQGLGLRSESELVRVDGESRRMYNGKMRRNGKGKGSRVKEEVSSGWGSGEGEVDMKQRGVSNVMHGGKNGQYRRNGGEDGYRRNGGEIGQYRSNGGESGQYRINVGENRQYRGKGGLRLNGSESEGVDRRQGGQGHAMRGGGNGQYRSSGGENGHYRGNGGARLNGSESEGVDRRSSGGYDSRGGGVNRRQRGQGRVMRGGENRHDRIKGGLELNGSEEVFDMRLRQDGSYEFQ